MDRAPESAGAAAGGTRNAAIDVLRALLLLYIVGFWHLFGYVGSGDGHINWVTDALTNVVLGTFTFMSGLMLGRWKGRFDAVSVLAFYRRRLLRIYPLYLLALAAFLVVWLVDWQTAVRAALLVSMFVPPAPATLWFITMIMVFYLIAPALVHSDGAIFAVLTAAVWLAIAAFDAIVNRIDPRILMYFPAFALGIVCCKHMSWFERRASSLGWLVPAFVVAMVVTRLRSGGAVGDALLSLPSIFTGALLAMRCAERYFGRAALWRPTQMLAYAGLTMYLFHRIVFTLAKRVYWPEAPWQQAAYLLLLALPLTWLVAYTIQAAYDALTRRTSGAHTASA